METVRETGKKEGKCTRGQQKLAIGGKGLPCLPVSPKNSSPRRSEVGGGRRCFKPTSSGAQSCLEENTTPLKSGSFYCQNQGRMCNGQPPLRVQRGLVERADRNLDLGGGPLHPVRVMKTTRNRPNIKSEGGPTLRARPEGVLEGRKKEVKYSEKKFVSNRQVNNRPRVRPS